MKINNFDLLRLIASLQVMVSHSISHVLIEQGYIINNLYWNYILKGLSYIEGVPIFFLISGFLIMMSYEKNPNLKEYAVNRILRIFPGLYVNIFIGVGILYYFGFVEVNLQFFSWLIAQLTIIQFYNAEMFRDFGVGVINGSLWTISVELTFYLILPILAYFFNKNKLVFIIISIISFLIWNYDVHSSKDFFLNKLIHVSIIPYIFVFLIGICFYKFFNSIKKYIEEKFLIWFCIYVFFSIMIHYLKIESYFLINIFKWFIFFIYCFFIYFFI